MGITETDSWNIRVERKHRNNLAQGVYSKKKKKKKGEEQILVEVFFLLSIAWHTAKLRR